MNKTNGKSAEDINNKISQQRKKYSQEKKMYLTQDACWSNDLKDKKLLVKCMKDNKRLFAIIYN